MDLHSDTKPRRPRPEPYEQLCLSLMQGTRFNKVIIFIYWYVHKEYSL